MNLRTDRWAARVSPQAVVQYFYDVLSCSDNEIALLVSAHAGHFVSRRTIIGIRNGEPGYSGRNLAAAFARLAATWNIV